jgi:Family of unknown function (DUF5670)
LGCGYWLSVLNLKLGGNPMFLILAIVLVLLWAGGFLLFHVSSFLIHILLIFAVISLVMHLVSGRRAA